MFGLIELGAWSSAIFLKDDFAYYLPYTSKATVLMEAIQLYLVYRAEDVYPNETFVDTMTTQFAYAVHASNMIYAAATIPIVDEWASAYKNEDIIESDDAEDDYATEAADDDYYGDYSYAGYY